MNIWDSPTVDRIIGQVSDRTGITRQAIFGRDRFAEVVHARHLVFWLIRYQLDWSYPQIARLFGMNHTSVMHGVARIDGARRGNRALRAWLDEHGARFIEVDR